MMQRGRDQVGNFSRKFPSSTNEVNFRSTDQNTKDIKSVAKSENTLKDSAKIGTKSEEK